MRTGQPSTLAF